MYLYDFNQSKSGFIKSFLLYMILIVFCFALTKVPLFYWLKNL